MTPTPKKSFFDIFKIVLQGVLIGVAAGAPLLALVGKQGNTSTDYLGASTASLTNLAQLIEGLNTPSA